MADQNPATVGDETESGEKPKQKSGKHFIAIGVITVLVVGALLFWWHSTFYEDTDDAQINGHLIQISARIAGQVIKVYVDENQQVKAGDPICDLDPRDFEVAVQQDEANLQAAEAAFEAAKVNVPITGINTGSTLRSTSSDVVGSEAQVAASKQQLAGALAQIAQAEANYTKANLDLERYKPLVEKDVISKQQWDQAVATADADKAALDNAKANESAARAQVKSLRRAREAGPGAVPERPVGSAAGGGAEGQGRPSSGTGRAGKIAAGTGKAESFLHQDRGAGSGDHHPQERGDQPERAAWART